MLNVAQSTIRLVSQSDVCNDGELISSLAFVDVPSIAGWRREKL